MNINLRGPLFGVSDLHMGDGGPRDNFAYGGHEKDFMGFLDYVEDLRGRLVIVGDLFELWQSNISKVITKREWLLDRLARMKAIYILGNHDADLLYFTGEKQWLSHPFFQRMALNYWEIIGGRKFYFTHGHEADPYCSGDTPGIGRITAIYSGLAEDRNGSPMFDKYQTIEDRTVGRLERLVSFFDRFRGKPDRFKQINRRLRDSIPHDWTCVCGHTHRPGHIGNWLYNCGTWAEHANSFNLINENGTVGIFDWANRSPTPNQTELPI